MTPHEKSWLISGVAVTAVFVIAALASLLWRRLKGPHVPKSHSPPGQAERADSGMDVIKRARRDIQRRELLGNSDSVSSGS